MFILSLSTVYFFKLELSLSPVVSLWRNKTEIKKQQTKLEVKERFMVYTLSMSLSLHMYCNLRIIMGYCKEYLYGFYQQLSKL